VSNNFLQVTPPAVRLSADERREQVLTVAMAAFARGGYDGTSTEEVARRAGISQPYLFRLFPTKKTLFCALVERGFRRVGEAFEQAAAGLTGQQARQAMGGAYFQLLHDRELLLVQLHAYAGCDDPEICAVTRREFRRLWRRVQSLAGLDDAAAREFFATGMLMNVMAAMNAVEVDEAWARACLERPSIST
jgi:AcrR family transcriptional regulator